MKINIPIEVVFDDLNSMIDELGKLQKYKFGEGDDMTLVDVCDVADILMRHVKAREAKRGTHWIPCSERLPDNDTEVFVYLFKHPSPYIAWITDSHWYTDEFEIEKENDPIAWMPLPKPYGGESDV